MMKSKFTVVVCALAIALAAVIGIFITLIATGVVDSTPKKLVISSGTAEKVYDGKEITSADWKLDSGTLREGYRLKVTTMGNQTDVGSCDNEFTAVVLDKNGADVSEDYELVLKPGKLVVRARMLVIKSASASKIYDGTPLTNHEWQLVSVVGVVEGHTVEVSVSGTITEAGEAKNTIAQVIVRDGNDKDVSYNYDVKLQEGTLTVKGTGGGSGGGTGGSAGAGVQMDGSIGGGGGDPKGIPLVDVTSSVTDSIYLKLGSFGDYNGKGWDRATAYDKLLDGKFGFDYLTGISLSNNGETEAKITIDNHMNTYVLATYLSMLDGDYAVQTSDEEYIGDTTLPYAAYYFYQRYIADYYSSFTSNLGKYAADELEYRNYVYANYMQVPDSTRAYLDEVIAHNGWKKGDANLLERVANYIQWSAKYNLKYDTTLDDEEDLVLAFLTKYKEGVCRHYASAATLMFRALGYPARYTVGLTGETIANKKVTITDKGAHAWTEVYLDGIGWVQLEVTGFSSDGGSGGSDDDKPSRTQKLELTPVTARKQYDGTALTPEQTIIDYNPKMYAGYAYIEDLLAKGYTYTATVTGSRTEIGYGISKITSFTLYDADGNDVTEDYEIRCRPGKLQVYISQLVFETGSATKTHDGTPIVATDCNLTFGTLVNGHRIAYALAKGSQTKVGTSGNTLVVSIVDADGNDVSEYYYIVGKYGTLTVVKRTIKVVSGSQTWTYNGYANTCLGWDYDESTEYKLVENHSALIAEYTEITDVGSCENKLTLLVYSAYDVDVTKDYDIVFVRYGTLTVEKRKVNVSTWDWSEVYRGEPMSFEYYCTVDETTPLADNQYLSAIAETITWVTNVADSGTQNIVQYNVVDQNGKDVTSNYEITYTYGVITVLPREVELQTASDSWTFDGEMHSAIGCNATENSPYDIVAWHTAVALSGYTTITHVGSEQNKVAYKIVDKDGNDVTENYAIGNQLGTLTNTPRYIKLKTLDYSAVYDGAKHYCTDWLYDDGTIDRIVDGQMLTAKSGKFATIENIGSVQNVIDFDVKYGTKIVTKNYNIEYVSYGTLTLTKREVWVATDSDTRIYDGAAHYKATYTVCEDSPYQFVAKQRVSVSSYTSITNVGTVINALTLTVKNSGKDVTDNYEIVYKTYGSLTVTPRKVTVCTATTQFEYDGQPHFDVNATVAAGSYGLVRSGVACGKICGRRYHYARPNKRTCGSTCVRPRRQ